MKILAPVDKVGEVENVIRAGAEELYCGLLSEEWLRRYGGLALINRRQGAITSFKSFEELKSCVEIAHSYNVPVSLCLNEHYYTQEQYPLLLNYVEKAVSTGIDSFLIADLGLLLTLKERRIDIPMHISIGGTTFNSETAKFYRDLGASRVTMPRHVTIGEIGKMVEEVPDLETTVFILNIRCANIDGFCTFNHFPLRCPEPEKLLGKERIEAFRISNPDFLSKDPIWTNACMLPYSISILYWNQEEAKREAACRKQSLWDRFHIDDIPCGACALYEFDEMDVTSAKIVGRGKPTEIKIRDIKFIRLLLDFLRSQRPSKEEFRETARRLHMYVYKAPCLTTTCYYPEVLSKEEVLL